MSQIVVPLYINSKDRIDIEKRTTDFNILIRKDLNNIKDVNVTNVSVPNILTTVNNTNNELSIGFYDGIKTFREIIALEIKNYDEATLSAEIENKLNASELSSNFGLTWTVFFANEKYTFQVDFLFGSVFSEWGINISYSRLLDYLGLSGGITTDIEYRVTSSSTLIFESSGTTNLLPSLYYNITSDALTGDFNTSYINSLGKLFNITDENKDLDFKIEETLDNITRQFPVARNYRRGINLSYSGFNGGKFSRIHDKVAFSTNIEDYPNGNTILYDVIDDNFTNVIRINGKFGTISENQSYGSYLSGDGNNMFIAVNDINNETGGVIVFIKDKFQNWTQQTVLTKTGSLSGDRYGFPLACSDNGNVLVFTSQEVKSPAVFIRAGETWIEVSHSMIACNNLTINKNGNIIAVSDYTFNSDMGRTVVYSFTFPTITPQSPDLIGSNQIALHQQGYSLSINSAGNILAIGSNSSYTTSSAWIFKYDGINWTEEESFASTNTAHSQYGLIVNLNDDGNVLAIAASTEYALGGPFAGGRWGVHIWEYDTSWSNSAFDLSFDPRYTTNPEKPGLIGIRSLELNNEGNSFWITFSGGPENGRSNLYRNINGNWEYVKSMGVGNLLNGVSTKDRGYAIHSRISEDGQYLITSANTQTDSFVTSGIERLVSVENSNDFIRDYAKLEGTNRTSSAVDISADGKIFVNLADGESREAFVTEEDDLGFDQTDLRTIIDSVTPLSDFRGEVIRISSDGTTIAVSDVNYNSNRGIVVILVKDGEEWIAQETITQPDTNVFFGRSIAISSDGNTIAIYTYDVGDCYQLWVYKRTEGLWELSFTDTPTVAFIRESRQGNVSVSGDGSKVVACSYSLRDDIGVVFVYHNGVRTELIATEKHGEAVEISADGTLIADSVKLWNPLEGGVIQYRNSPYTDGGLWTNDNTGTFGSYVRDYWAGAGGDTRGIRKSSGNYSSIYYGIELQPDLFDYTLPIQRRSGHTLNGVHWFGIFENRQPYNFGTDNRLVGNEPLFGDGCMFRYNNGSATSSGIIQFRSSVNGDVNFPAITNGDYTGNTDRRLTIKITKSVISGLLQNNGFSGGSEMDFGAADMTLPSGKTYYLGHISPVNTNSPIEWASGIIQTPRFKDFIPQSPDPSVLIWRFINDTWSRNEYDIMANLTFLEGEDITINSEAAKSLSIAQVKGGYIVSAGVPIYHAIYYTYINVPVVFERRRSIDINTFYTVFGITQKLNEILTNLPLEETVETKFTFDKETGIIRVDFISSLDDATYSIDVNSSLLQSIYTFLNVINNKQSDIVVDLSINNNVIKTINIYNDSHDAIINYDGVIENTIRPYKPGFFINIKKNIDIQVRNERDQIIDLRGIDIALTVLISL